MSLDGNSISPSQTPGSTLRIPEHEVLRPRFPVIDAHNHLGSEFAGDWPGRPVAELLTVLNEAGVTMMVDLDGGWGEHLRAEIARYQQPHPERFAVFAGIDYENLRSDPRFGETEARRLRESAAIGARGLKIWKLLGLRARDAHGRLIPVNDPRLDPLWQTAAELRLPVVIHVGDPIAFFQPLDRTNERWEVLQRRPEWHFYPTRPKGALEHPGFPSFDELMEQFEDLLRRHPQTTFVGAHVGGCAEDLRWVGRLLDACPRFFVDIGARVAELGRQPYSAYEFFIRYQDRILFGLDMPAEARYYRLYYRFLETRDEYFEHNLDHRPGPGNWRIYGLGLPDAVLKKVYCDNARRIILRQGAD